MESVHECLCHSYQKLRLDVEWSRISLTTLLCPFMQVFIHGVHPRMSLAFNWGETFLITFTHSGNVAVVFYEKRIFFVQIRSSCRSVRIKDLCSSYFPTPYFFTLCVHSLNFVRLWTNQQVFIVTLWRQVAMACFQAIIEFLWSRSESEK